MKSSKPVLLVDNYVICGTIPVVPPEYLFEINYKVAEEFGVTVPEGLLSRADKIIR